MVWHLRGYQGVICLDAYSGDSVAAPRQKSEVDALTVLIGAQYAITR